MQRVELPELVLVIEQGLVVEVAPQQPRVAAEPAASEVAAAARRRVQLLQLLQVL